MSLDNYGGSGYPLAELDEMPLAEREGVLAEAIVGLRQKIAELKAKLDEAESMIRERMLADGAKIADAGTYEVKLVRTLSRNEYDIEGLVQLRDFVPAAMFAAALHPTFEVDKRALNEILKRGGPAKDIIDQSVLPHYRYSLDFKRRPTTTDNAAKYDKAATDFFGGLD